MAGKIRRTNRLTQARLKELLHYDPATGVFTNRITRGKARAGSVAGTITGDGYVQICLDRELHFGHRLAWLYVKGVWPDPECDHENRNRGDNRWVNLREASVAQQRQNMAVRRDNRTGFKGVRWDARKQRYSAKITVNGVIHVLGQGFLTAEEAGAAYVAAKARLHPFQPTIPVAA